jgi:gliding motility-associated-like protein
VLATHIVGGEMNYKSLGNDNYEITLTVYRDCYNGQAPFDNPAHIGVFDRDNNLLSTFLMYLSAPIENIPNAINSPCLVAPTEVCYEVARYTEVVSLQAIAGGYQLAYQRCCRNHTIINVQNPGAMGATITANIPDPFTTPVDANPVFNNLPPNFICLDAPFIFDHSATDPDGDVLVYELCIPYDGASQNNPMPSTPSPPPYDPIVYQFPYSISNFLGGVPMTINSMTGIIHAVPSTLGQFVYGIRVKEYRNGNYIGETRREFQVNVQECGTITIAGIFSPTIACGSPMASFLNLSYGAGSYSWNFGDPASGSNNTSTLAMPSHVYTDTGSFQVQLIAFSSIDPACNDTDYGVVYVYPEFNTLFSTNNIHCSPTFHFNDLSYGVDGAADYWYWDFGDGQSSGLQDPSHLYMFPGIYNVTLIASTDSGCTDTISKTINVLPLPNSQFSIGRDSCSNTISITNASTQASYYSWNFGDGGTILNPDNSYAYSATGTYTIQLIARSDSGCVDTSKVNVLIPPVPIPDFTFSYSACDSVVHFTNLSVNSTLYYWDFGDMSYAYNPSPNHLYHGNGPYTVTLQANSMGNVCQNSIEKVIELDITPTAYFDVTVDTCTRVVHIDNSSSPAIYSWNYGGAGTFSNDTYTYNATGNYNIQLIAQNNSGCADTMQIAILLPELPILDFSYDYSACDSIVHFTNLSINGTDYYWDFGDNNSSATFNASHLFPGNGPYIISLHVTGPGMTCANNMQEQIQLERNPIAMFNTALDTCFYKLQTNNQSQFASQYSWWISDGNFSTDANPSHDFMQAGNYSIRLIASTTSGCTDTSAISLNLPPKAIADYSIIHTDCDSLVSLSNNSQNASSYHWTFGDSDTSTLENPDHTYINPGNVQIQLVATSPHQCRDTVTKEIDLVFRIPAEFSLFTDTCSSITYFRNSSPRANTYDWDFGDGTESSATNPFHIYHSTNGYAVTFITNMGTVCEERTTGVVKFEEREGEIISIPNTFTPNNDGKNDRFHIFSYRPCEVYSLNIFNRWGERVYESDDALNVDWDGRYKGNFIEEGVYVYYLEGRTVNKTGYILVIK